MSIEKVIERIAPEQGVGRRRAQPGKQGAARERQLDFLSLSVEDDAGGDPYNRTGQHCLADLKKRAR